MEERPEVCAELEEQRWVPGAMNDADIDECLQIARSVAAIRGLYDGRSTTHGCNAASRDDVIINALEVVSLLVPKQWKQNTVLYSTVLTV